MDWLQVLEQYGIPLVVACAFWIFIQKRTAFIENELQKELRESFTRIEMIIVKLIDQQKMMQIEQKGLEKSLKIVTDLLHSAFNAFKYMAEVFRNMFGKNDDK